MPSGLFFKWRATDRAQIKRLWHGSHPFARGAASISCASPIGARVNYVGPWLPEPIHPATPPAVDDKLATSLTTAVLLLLERLTPKERAAYLLHEIFDQAYGEIAAMLEMDEAACRKRVSAPVKTSITIRFATSRQRKLRTTCSTRSIGRHERQHEPARRAPVF